MLKAYLAGPEVFLTNASEIGARKREICADYGLQGLFPLDKEIEASTSDPADVAGLIFHVNRELLLAADLVIANLTPFRGPSMDVGTAFEVGFACAMGRLVFGYSNDERDLVGRIAEAVGLRKGHGRAPQDALGMEVENFGFVENLMVEVPIRESGGTVIVRSVPSDKRYTDLEAFEQCVARAAAICESKPSPLRRSLG